MILVKTPLRISLFGGSTDYQSFYQDYGSFLIGTTINQYAYMSMRIRPCILSKESMLVYSQLQRVNDFEKINNPLIREILKYKNIRDHIEFLSFSDVPFRTGLGGSSSYCVGMLYLINRLYNHRTTSRELVREAIKIEREILNESGGIQDHIWPVYPGLNSIEIDKEGEFYVKPIPVTADFKRELEDHFLLLYTNEQRQQEEIASSHIAKDKKAILHVAKEAYNYFVNEDIESIGKLLYESWLEKQKISNLISTPKIDEIITRVMDCGAYGAKLLGAGGCGFVLCICNPWAKARIKLEFGDQVLESFKFENDGVSQIYPCH